MPTDKLAFRLIGKEAAVVGLLFLKGLLLLLKIFIVGHSITRIVPSSIFINFIYLNYPRVDTGGDHTQD